jgi:hypothetical protein
MNAAHLHLITTHVPVYGTFLGFCLLLLALMKRSEELKRTSLLVFVCAAVLVVPTYLSGPAAAEQMKTVMPGMSLEPGEQHAEVAILALVGSLILGTASLTGLVSFRKRPALPGWFVTLAVVLGLLVSALMGWTANLGGRVRHTEIRHSTSATGGAQY